MATTSKLAYGHAVNHLFSFAAGRCLTRALLQEWKAGMEGLAPSSIDVRLSAVRKLIAEARRNGMLAVEEAANLTDIPNVRQQGTRLGNWLTREQAKELLAVPDRSTLKGKRDYVLLALLVGCALRRRELAALEVETIATPRRSLGSGRSGGEGKTGPDGCGSALGQADHQCLADRGRDRGGPVASLDPEGGKRVGDALSDWAVWDVGATVSPRDRVGRVYSSFRAHQWCLPASNFVCWCQNSFASGFVATCCGCCCARHHRASDDRAQHVRRRDRQADFVEAVDGAHRDQLGAGILGTSMWVLQIFSPTVTTMRFIR